MRDFFEFEGYIFDLDGTLFDSMGLWAEVYRKALCRFGVAEIPADYIREVNVRSVSEGARYTAERFSLPVGGEGVVAAWKAIAGDVYATSVEMKQGAAELARTRISRMSTFSSAKNSAARRGRRWSSRTARRGRGRRRARGFASSGCLTLTPIVRGRNSPRCATGAWTVSPSFCERAPFRTSRDVRSRLTRRVRV